MVKSVTDFVTDFVTVNISPAISAKRSIAYSLILRWWLERIGRGAFGLED